MTHSLAQSQKTYAVYICSHLEFSSGNPTGGQDGACTHGHHLPGRGGLFLAAFRQEEAEGGLLLFRQQLHQHLSECLSASGGMALPRTMRTFSSTGSSPGSQATESVGRLGISARHRPREPRRDPGPSSPPSRSRHTS